MPWHSAQKMKQYLNLSFGEKFSRLRKYILTHGWILRQATDRAEYFEPDNASGVTTIMIPVGTEWADLSTRWWCALGDISSEEGLSREEAYLKILSET